MQPSQSLPGALAHFIHRRFIWLLIGSYLLAGMFPGPGLWIKDLTLGHIPWGQFRVSLPMAMLALLLFNAALGLDVSALGKLVRRPASLLAGLTANLLIPILFIFAVSRAMRVWHNPDEVQNILVGLALVASMPIAGSSTAWSQNANGNLALSLGLVLGSTFLSPLTTPVALHAVGLMTTGDYSEDLHELATTGGTSVFLILCVIVPSVLGIVAGSILGKQRHGTVKVPLKLVNSAILLTLNYSNASVSLPQAISSPDWDFLAVVLSMTAALCLLSFAAGWWISRLLKADGSERVALMFGMGMNNNGTGLVLASMALADHPSVMLPIIFYNLVQHLVAGGVDHFFFNSDKS